MTSEAVLGSRYRLLGKIGVGGMAEVYRALSLGAHGFEKVVAIKRILPAYATDPELVERLIDEAKLAVSLTHANVVQVLDFGYMDESLYIAMELVEGLDLREVHTRIRRSGGPVSADFAIAVGVDVLRALEFAHERASPEGRPLGIVHCDVSPSNVLVSWAGEVKLTDFGIARANAPHRRSFEGIVAGKAPYMAPEQFEAHGIDLRTDLYAVGVLVYELLVGRRPHEGDRAQIHAAAHAGRVVRPSAARPDLHPSLDAPILAALAPSPDDRPPSAGAMLRALVAARRAASLGDDPQLVRETMRRLGSQTARTEAEALDEAMRETAVRSLLSTAKEVPIAGSVESEALPTRATRAVAVPVGKGRRRTVVSMAIAAVLAIAAAAFAWTRMSDAPAPPAPPMPHGRIAATSGLEDVARRSETSLRKALEGLPQAEPDAPPLRVTGRVRPAAGGVQIRIEATLGGRAHDATARASAAEIPDRVPALAARALSGAMRRPVILPAQEGPSVAAARAYNEAVLAIVRGRLQNAVGRLDDLLALDPGFEAAIRLRLVAAWLGTTPSNRAALENARVRLASDPHGSALVEVVSRFVERRWDDTVGEAERALASLGPDPEIELFLGEAFIRQGRFDEGMERLRALRGRSPFISLVAYHGAQNALARDDRTELEAWLDAVRESDPTSPVADALDAIWILRHGTADDRLRLARSDRARSDPSGEVELVIALSTGQTSAALEANSQSALGGGDPGMRARASLNLARLGLARGRFRERTRWLDVARRADPAAGGVPVAAQSALAGALDTTEAAAILARALAEPESRTIRSRTLDASILAAAAGAAPPSREWRDREFEATLEGLARARANDADAARAALRRAAEAPTEGYALPLAGFLRAWLSRRSDPREVLAGCDDVLRPRVSPQYVAALHPRCLRWSAAAARALGDSARAADLEQRLERLWAGADRPVAWLDSPPFPLVP